MVRPFETVNNWLVVVQYVPVKLGSDTIGLCVCFMPTWNPPFVPNEYVITDGPKTFDSTSSVLHTPTIEFVSAASDGKINSMTLRVAAIWLFII